NDVIVEAALEPVVAVAAQERRSEERREGKGVAALAVSEDEEKAEIGAGDGDAELAPDDALDPSDRPRPAAARGQVPRAGREVDDRRAARATRAALAVHIA